MIASNGYLKYIELNNIRSFKYAKIDFSDGTTLVRGDNGAGKSTVGGYGIEFALLGLSNVSGHSLLREGEQKGSIKLVFVICEREIKITRELHRNTNSSVDNKKCIIEDENGYRSVSPKDLKGYVLTLLNYRESYSPTAKCDMYRFSIFTPQEEMSSILSMKSDDRLQTLRKAFGIEKYRNAHDNANEIKKQIKKKIKELDIRSEKLYEHKTNLGKERDEYSDDEQECKHIEEQKESYRKNLTELNNNKNVLETEREPFNQSKGKASGLIERIKDKQKDIGKHNKLINDSKIHIEEIDKECEKLSNIEFLSNIELISEPISEPISERYISELQDEINKLTNKKMELNHKRRSFDQSKGKASGIIERIKDKQKDIGKHNKSINDSKIHIEEIDKYCEKLRVDLKVELKVELKVDSHANTSIEELVQEKNKYNELINKCNKDKGKIESIITSYDNIKDKGICTICGQNVDREKFQNKIEENKKELEYIESNITEYNKKILYINQLIGTVEKYNSSQKEINIYNKQKIGYEKIIKDSEEAIISIKEEINSLNDTYKSLSEESIEYEKLSEEIDSIDKTIIFTTNLISKIERYNGIQGRVELYNKQKIGYEKIIKDSEEAIISIKDEINSLNDTYKSLSKESTKFDNISNKINQLNNKITDITNKLYGADRNLSTKEGDMRRRKEYIEKLAKDVKDEQEYANMSNSLGEYATWLEQYFMPVVKEIEDKMFIHTKHQFDQYLQRWFNLLMENDSMIVSVDEKFTPVIKYNGYGRDINDLSGGEKAGIAFAYRLALNKLVSRKTGSKLNLLILDEPTYGLSDKRLAKFGDIIRELGYRQIILISHEKQLESVADRIIEIVNKDGESKVL